MLNMRGGFPSWRPLVIETYAPRSRKVLLPDTYAAQDLFVIGVLFCIASRSSLSDCSFRSGYGEVHRFAVANLTATVAATGNMSSKEWALV